MELEHSLLKGPYESLNKTFRNSQKLIEKEITAIVNQINDLNSKQATISKDEAFQTLEKLATKLSGLKRKLDECKKEELSQIQQSKNRIDHLNTISEVDLKSTSGDSQRRWFKTRLDRVLVDYLLREGFYQTAIMLSKDSNISELVDIDIFMAAKKVVESLSCGDCKEALKWCSDNRSKLKKINSELEFLLRIQEFIELVRNSRTMEAIAYARKHLAPLADTNMPQIQVAMATLAFGKDTTCEKYAEMFSKSKWLALVDHFKQENYQIYSLPKQSLLETNLKSGLSALKTWYCYDPENHSVNCPVCNPLFRELAKDLPYALFTHSRLLCRISGEPINDENPPMVLPNGNAYGLNAMCDMAAKNDGKIICPRTGQVFEFEELRKAFIV